MTFEPHIEHAIEAAILASQEILNVYAHDFEVMIKSDKSPLTIADLNASKAINAVLNKTKIPIISEEISNLPFKERKNWPRCWVVDPLDGTKEFIKKNNEFAVCIALVENGIVKLGIIASPTENKLYLASKQIGLFELDFNKNSKNWNLPINYPEQHIPNVLLSRSHLTDNLEPYLNELREKYGEINFMQKGSALKFVDMAIGKADFYPRFGPTMEWDVAAGQVILEVVGGAICNAKTRIPLQYNKMELKNPFFIAESAFARR
jgi:3'(2'), 5'-bisphosphate nucleotidase